MAKVTLDYDELWPIYFISDSKYGRVKEISLPDELIEEYKAINNRWYELQDILEEYYKGEKKDETSNTTK